MANGFGGAFGGGGRDPGTNIGGEGYGGAGHGGRSSYGGGGGEGGRGRTSPATRRSTGFLSNVMSRMSLGGIRDVQSSLRGMRDEAQDALRGLFGPDEDEATAVNPAAPTAVDPTGRRGITDAALQAQTQEAIDAHRDRGKMAARGARGAALLAGPFAGIPGMIADFMAGQQHEALSEMNQRDPFAAARTLAADQLRGYEPGEGGAEERMNLVELQRAKPPKPPKEEPEAPAEPTGMDDVQRHWWETYGIAPNDPRLADPDFDPTRPAARPAQAAAHRQRISRDIQSARRTARQAEARI